MANNPTNFFIQLKEEICLWVQVLTILASILIATMDPLMIRMGVGCSAWCKMDRNTAKKNMMKFCKDEDIISSQDDIDNYEPSADRTLFTKEQI